MASTDTPENALIKQLASPPNISLQILGTHTKGPTKVVDFDLWIDCSKDVKIMSGEFVTRNKNEIVHGISLNPVQVFRQYHLAGLETGFMIAIGESSIVSDSNLS
jgi:hypothetical protein